MGFYIISTLSSMLISYFAEKRDNKFLVILSVIILSLLSGLRGQSVGFDTANYYATFRDLLYFGTYWGHDTGFGLISKGIVNLFGTPIVPFIIYSFLINGLIIFRFWTMRNKASFSWMMVVYVCFYYMASMNIMRQYIAVAILFFATYFLEKQKYKTYIFFVLIAFLFHYSSILGFIILFIYLVSDNEKKLTVGRFIMINLIVIVSLVAFVIVFNSRYSQFSTYFSNTIFNVSVTTIYKIIVCAFIVFFSKEYNSQYLEKNGIYYSLEREHLHLYILGLALSLVGMLYPNMDRISLPFIFFEMPVWGETFCISKSKNFMIFLMSIVLIYVYIFSMINNGQGIFPYYTFMSQPS